MAVRRYRFSTMTEPLDAELLKDLRGLGKPPSFDGNDAEYQCGLSHVDGQVPNRAKSDLPGSSEIAHLKCCIQMYYSLTLITKGSEERQTPYALMQEIMTLTKLWCDHAEGFESGLSLGAGCRRVGTGF